MAQDNGFNGSTPLHCALSRGSLEVATLLISKGADINVSSSKNVSNYHDISSVLI